METSSRVRGCCPLDCQDTCSWIAHVEDGRVTRVEGAPDHPITRGVLCAKVNDYQERTYAPDRLLYPLRRTGPKGTGSFERISWEEALGTIARRFDEIIGDYGPEALLPFQYLGSMGVVQRRALLRLFHFLGASRQVGSVCGASGNVLEAEGHPRGIDPEEMVHSRFVLIWGANILTTSHHHWPFIKEAQQHGARVVCIDPLRTRTARASDQHVSILPGTDCALAAGMAHVMLEEGLADLDFARRVTADIDDYCAEVRAWTPERAAAVCGTDPEVVRELGRAFGRARPALIRGGVGLQQTVHGEATVRALSALAILGGHWRHQGGGLFIESCPVIHEGRAARPDLSPADARQIDMARLGDALVDESLQPPVKGLMVWNANPAVSQPDAGKVRQGMMRDDLFTVVVEHFLTDTAKFADVVLPSTTQLEHFDIQGAWGHYYVSVNNPAVAPLGEAKTHGEIMRLLAREMGLDHEALRESDEEIAAAALPEGIDLDTLKATGWFKSPPDRPRLRENGTLLRISERVPVPARPIDGALLQLLTPKSHFFMNSSFGNMPRQRKAMKRPTLDIHPADASSRGLVDGQEVVVKNAQGSLRTWLRVTADTRPGVVCLPGKWWSVPLETGALANTLSPSTWSPGGQPAYNETFVEVSAVDAGRSEERVRIEEEIK